jgi:hypothetical protein
VVFIIDAILLGDDGEDLGLEFRGRLRTLIRRCGSVPILQKGVLLFGIGQILCPAGERFHGAIEQRGVGMGDRCVGCILNFARELAGGEQVARGLGSEDETQLCGLSVDVLLEFFLFFLNEASCALYASTVSLGARGTSCRSVLRKMPIRE